ncbi:MAG: restriction endonuclease [Firmicutes bacterium]|nr:restriction endonuclease [Bacillota bacterium]
MAKVQKKVRLPARRVIAQAWAPLLKHFLHVDINLPVCWACHTGVPFDPSAEGAARWDTARGLDRHHIVPESLGGTADARNLFLICPACHAQAPTTDTPEIFYAWLETRLKKTQREAKKIERSLRELLPGKRDFEAIVAWAAAKDPAELRGIILGAKVGVHFDSKKGPTIPISGVVGFLVQQFRKETAGQAAPPVQEKRNRVAEFIQSVLGI